MHKGEGNELYGFVFGLFAVALLFMYGMIHTFSLVKRTNDELEHKNKYLRYGRLLGLYGCLSFALGVIVYFYGIG